MDKRSDRGLKNDRGLNEKNDRGFVKEEKKRMAWVARMDGLWVAWKAWARLVAAPIRWRPFPRFPRFARFAQLILPSLAGRPATPRVESTSAAANPTHCRSSLPPASTSLPPCRTARSNARLHTDDSRNSPRNSVSTIRGSLRRTPQDTSPLSSKISHSSQSATLSSPSPVSPVSPVSPREGGTLP